MKPIEIVYSAVRSAHRTLGSSPRIALGAAASLSLLLICPLLLAAEGADVMRVEEDWEVVLNEPDLDVEAPQFHTVCSPFGNLDSVYLQAYWNYREQPDFLAGGMQLAAWLGDYCVDVTTCQENPLSTAAETITWTTAMETNGSCLRFKILNGSSQTWGSFGEHEIHLHHFSESVAIPHLNGYSTDLSVSNSWISYGANRVNLLRIKEVRSYDADGNLISRDQTPRVVFELE